MSQDWRNRDPIEDKLFNGSQPDLHVSRMEDVNQKIEETRQNLNDESVIIVSKFVEVVAKSHQTRRKAKSVEQEIKRNLE